MDQIVMKAAEGGEVCGVVAATLVNRSPVMNLEPALVGTPFAGGIDMGAATAVAGVNRVFLGGRERMAQRWRFLWQSLAR